MVSPLGYRYGWSALHYACSEGDMDVVRALVALGVDVRLRDKDGTSAAFRAEINHHDDIVCFLCEQGEEDDMLYIDPEYVGRDAVQPTSNDIYSQIRRDKKSSATASKPNAQSRDTEVLPEPDKRPVSEILSSSGKPWDTLRGRIKEDPQMTIRRIIRKELEQALKDTDDVDSSDEDEGCYDEEGYMRSADVMAMARTSQQKEEEKKKKREENLFANSGIGLDTLKGILRDEAKELLRTRSMAEPSFERLAPGSSETLPTPSARARAKQTPDYEDIYETVRHLKRSASVQPKSGSTSITDSDLPRDPPPLPPRSLGTLFRTPKADASGGSSTGPFSLNSPDTEPESSSAALVAAFDKLSASLGTDWKKLAYALPMDFTPLKVNERIMAIEEQFPEDPQKQAKLALKEWRLNTGFQASVDDLILGLREAKLHPLIDVVERAAQEFTA